MQIQWTLNTQTRSSLAHKLTLISHSPEWGQRPGQRTAVCGGSPGSSIQPWPLGGSANVSLLLAPRQPPRFPSWALSPRRRSNPTYRRSISGAASLAVLLEIFLLNPTADTLKTRGVEGCLIVPLFLHSSGGVTRSANRKLRWNWTDQWEAVLRTFWPMAC